jgi:hypothetical protein
MVYTYGQCFAQRLRQSFFVGKMDQHNVTNRHENNAETFIHLMFQFTTTFI